MSRSDLDHWEKRYSARAASPGPPLPWLAGKLDWLRPGAVLDVAGGEGANALYLRRKGWAVTLIDISPTALARLKGQAGAEGLEIEAHVHDLDQPLQGLGLVPFANMLLARYKPSDGQWPDLLSLLAPGGRLLICSFGAARAGVNPAYRYALEELQALFSGELELLLHEELEEGLEGFVFERPG